MILAGSSVAVAIAGNTFHFSNTHGFACLGPSCASWFRGNEALVQGGLGVAGQSSRVTPFGVPASNLAADAVIGANRQFRGGLLFFSTSSPVSFAQAGSWGPGANGYLGLELQIDGQAHYGWAALAAHTSYLGPPFADFGLEYVLTGYAYDTVAGQSIEAGQTTAPTPEPATLGLLALGSLGLGLWRRRKAGATQQ